MRWLGRTIFVVLLLCVACWYGNALWQRLSPHRFPHTSSHMDQLKNASTRLTYTLDRVKWTLFTIPAGATSLRVSTNANLPTALAAEPEAEWSYALTYELLNAKGQLETQHVYHHRSRTTRHTNPSTNESTLAAFYLDASLTPTDTRSFVLDLSGFPSAARIRFRLASQDESLTDVSLSLYARAPINEHQVDYLWRRLPDDQKQSLAKGLVYTIDFLEQPERIQLLKNRWQALGPKGIEGRDYHTRKLYVLENLEPENPPEPTLPSGLIVDAKHDGVMSIPADGISLRLDFLPLSASHRPPDQNGIYLTWYSKNAHEQSSYRVKWQDTATRFEETFAPGLLKIQVLEGATVVQAFRREAAQYTPWMDEPSQSRMYRIEPDQSIDFTIVHANQLPTPLRIDVRHLPYRAHPANTLPLAVAYEFFNTAGKVIQSGQLTSAATMSRYDYIPSLNPDTSVSDPSTFFFAIPIQVTRLRFSLPSPPPVAPMLIAVWNRPPELIRELYIGHDSVDHSDDTGDPSDAMPDDQRQWAWFPKRPDAAKDLVAEQRSYLLHVQPRPQDNTDLQLEDYQVESYRPEGMWHGRYIFLPREPLQTQLSPQALAVAFQPLRSGREQHLVLGGLPQLRFLQPTLMYFSNMTKPQTFEVIIDGIQQHQGAVNGQHGEIELPVIPAGAHHINIHSQPETRWYINHVLSGTPTHVKRLAYRFDTSGLSFIYERQYATDETLSMRWHAPYGTRQPTRIRVHLAFLPTSRHTPSTSWTFHERRYVLAPMPGPAIPVLNTDASYVDSGQPFFLPIGQDVPAGRYRIRMRLEQGPRGYLTLIKLNRGIFESRQFTGEKVPPYVQN